MRSISWRLATAALLMSWLAARISSSAMVSGTVRGVFPLAARAPSVRWRSAKSIRR